MTRIALDTKIEKDPNDYIDVNNVTLWWKTRLTEFNLNHLKTLQKVKKIVPILRMSEKSVLPPTVVQVGNG